MNAKYRLIIVVLVAVLIIWKTFQYVGLDEQKAKSESREIFKDFDDLPGAPGDIEVTVYYEALCSDSRNFILKQLLPAFKLLGKYIKLDLVPYGKAKTIETGGKIEFQCQHGPAECLGNKIHACTINLIANPMLQLNMVACMIDDGLVPFDAAARCAAEYKVDYNAIVDCTNDITSSVLLKKFGERTNAVHPAITFIPTIELDGAQPVPLPKLLKDFKKELCGYFKNKPVECI